MTEASERSVGGWTPDRQSGPRRAAPRAWLAAGSAALIIALAATVTFPPRPVLVWNATPSSPVGFYLVLGPKPVARGDAVIARLPRGAARLAADRRYLPLGIPVVKPAAAIAGDSVCAAGEAIFVNGVLAALRRRADPSGRPLPWWSGCRSLGTGEILLLASAAPDSFDGRYFGTSRLDHVIGRAHWLGRP